MGAWQLQIGCKYHDSYDAGTARLTSVCSPSMLQTSGSAGFKWGRLASVMANR